MGERPILFSGPLVRAILDRRKTQTRRLITPQPEHVREHMDGRIRVPDGWRWRETYGADDGGRFAENVAEHCPFGRRRDLLWVRETWRTGVALDHMSPAAIADQCINAGYVKPWAPLKYEADGATINDDNFHRGDFGGGWGKTRVAIHLPRWASRLLLEVTEVRVQRLQDITEEDARAEGVRPSDAAAVFEGGAGRRRDMEMTARGAFACLWDEINGDRALWKSNPWVWAITFRRVP